MATLHGGIEITLKEVFDTTSLCYQEESFGVKADPHSGDKIKIKISLEAIPRQTKCHLRKIISKDKNLLPESEKRRFSRPRDISKSTADFDETKLKTKSPQLARPFILKFGTIQSYHQPIIPSM